MPNWRLCLLALALRPAPIAGMAWRGSAFLRHVRSPPTLAARGARARAHMAAGSAAITEDELIKRFVMQRSLQTVMFYMKTCRDGATAEWLERFLDLRGIDEYHGLDGLPNPWRETVESLLEQPPETIVLHSIPRNRAGSGNNPYLPPRVLTIDFDIVPQRIALRLLDCAGEVASEVQADLGRKDQENALIRKAYIAAQTDDEAAMRAGSYPTLAHEPEGTSKSAFRGGTYDLLKRLTTRQAVRRAIVALEKKPAAAGFLTRFFASNGTRFDGEHGYNVADDFLRALLSQMPAVSSSGAFIDPVGIADVILTEREAVAGRYREALATMPGDLQDLKRAFLEKGLR
jgi:hypothetical protein